MQPSFHNLWKIPGQSKARFVQSLVFMSHLTAKCLTVPYNVKWHFGQKNKAGGERDEVRMEDVRAEQQR